MKYTTILENGINNLLEHISRERDLEQFFEEIALKNITTGALSGITSRSLNSRLNDPGANRGIEVIEAQLSPSEDSLTIFFNVEPTWADGTTTVLSPTSRPYDGTFYNVVFQFSKAKDFMGDLNTFDSLTPEQQTSAVAKLMLNGPVKLYSNDPSFYYQGIWEDLAKVDGALYSFPGPPGDGVWHDKHVKSGGLSNPNIRISKHIAAIAFNIASFVPQILNKMRKL